MDLLYGSGRNLTVLVPEKELFQRVDLLCVDNGGFGNPTKGDGKQLLQLIELLLDLIGLVLGVPKNLLPVRLKKRIDATSRKYSLRSL